MGPKNINSKAEAGRAKKAAAEAEKAAKAAALREAEDAQDWQKGANVRGASRAGENAARADEAARKRAEKAALLAAEEAELGPGGKVKVVPNKRKSKKNDLSLLEDALTGAAEKKTRQQKKAMQLRKEKEEQAAREREEKKRMTMDPLLQNTEAMIEGAVGREANVQTMGETSGLDGALEQLDITASTEVKSGRALHAAFEERVLPQMREDYPGLKLSQYKEKIFNEWKKSPENPRNSLIQE